MIDKKLYSIPAVGVRGSPLEAMFVVEPADLYKAAADPEVYIRGRIEATFRIDECYLREYRRREADIQAYFRERFAAALDRMMMDVLMGRVTCLDSSEASAASSSTLDVTPSKTPTTSTPTRSS